MSTSRSRTSGAAIVGIGATEFSKASGRSEQRLAVEAILAALADAGLSPEDVDGTTTLAVEATYEQALQRSLGFPELTFFARAMGGGGGGAATVALAAQAIYSGSANVVVCYRALNERSQLRFGVPPLSISSSAPTTQTLDMAWTAPFGVVTPAAGMALNARRYLHMYDRTTDDFARLAVAQRAYAATNPNAFFYKKPLTMDAYYASRMIADPLRLLDCCQESDGAVAIVLTSADRASHLRHRPVHVTATAMGLAHGHLGLAHMFRDPSALPVETAMIGAQLWKKSGLSPADIDVAILYDHFGPAVLMQLESLGFCQPGEAGDLVADGGIALDGQIPLNTHGGQTGEAYIHGFNGIAEAVRQLRGEAVNQVTGATRALVTAASHVPTSGMILEVER